MRRPELAPGDLHLVGSRSGRHLKVFEMGKDGKGREVITFDARFDGYADDPRLRGGDTPVGLWSVGVPEFIPPDDHQRPSLGPVWIPILDVEGQASKWNRSAFGIHGGGTSLGRVAETHLEQGWSHTAGCVRQQNGDALTLAGMVLLVRRAGRRVWFSVYP